MFTDKSQVMSSLFTMVLSSGDVLRINDDNVKWRPDGTWKLSLVVKPTGLPSYACPVCVD